MTSPEGASYKITLFGRIPEAASNPEDYKEIVRQIYLLMIEALITVQKQVPPLEEGFYSVYFSDDNLNGAEEALFTPQDISQRLSFSRTLLRSLFRLSEMQLSILLM